MILFLRIEHKNLQSISRIANAIFYHSSHSLGTFTAALTLTITITDHCDPSLCCTMHRATGAKWFRLLLQENWLKRAAVLAPTLAHTDWLTTGSCRFNESRSLALHVLSDVLYRPEHTTTTGHWPIGVSESLISQDWPARTFKILKLMLFVSLQKNCQCSSTYIFFFVAYTIFNKS